MISRSVINIKNLYCQLISLKKVLQQFIFFTFFIGVVIAANSQSDMYISSGANFKTHPNAQIGIFGNIENHGNLNSTLAANGKYYFVGNTSQIINGSQDVEIDTLVLDNSEDLYINDIDLKISGCFDFMIGKLITQPTTTLYINNSSPNAITDGVISGNDTYIEGRVQWEISNGITYRFPLGVASYGAQGFDFTATAGQGKILAYLEPNTTNPILTTTYCDIETNTGSGSGQVGSGSSGPDGVLDRIDFDLSSPLQWDITNPSGSGAITSYDITVFPNNGQDISTAQASSGTDLRYLLKDGEPGENVTTQNGTSDWPNINGFLACPNGYSLVGMNSFSHFTLNGATPASTLLPVKLLYFDIEKNLEINSVNLLWATATEINNSHFEIEKSFDGIDFNLIGSIKGNNNSTEVINYNFTDFEPFNGNNYYRLKQIDYNNSFEYSKIRNIYFDKNNLFEISVFPNPFHEDITLTIETSQLKSFDIKVIDLYGKIVYENEINQINQENIFKLNIGNVPAGSYFIKVNEFSYPLVKLER